MDRVLAVHRRLLPLLRQRAGDARRRLLHHGGLRPLAVRGEDPGCHRAVDGGSGRRAARADPVRGTGGEEGERRAQADDHRAVL